MLSFAFSGCLQSFDPADQNFDGRFQLGNPLSQCGFYGNRTLWVAHEEGATLLGHHKALMTKLSKRVLNRLGRDPVHLGQLPDGRQASTRRVLAGLDTAT